MQRSSAGRGPGARHPPRRSLPPGPGPCSSAPAGDQGRASAPAITPPGDATKQQHAGRGPGPGIRPGDHPPPGAGATQQSPGAGARIRAGDYFRRQPSTHSAGRGQGAKHPPQRSPRRSRNRAAARRPGAGIVKITKSRRERAGKRPRKNFGEVFMRAVTSIGDLYYIPPIVPPFVEIDERAAFYPAGQQPRSVHR